VLLSAWPSNETVSALPVGASFATVPLARTVAGRDGSYQLRGALSPLSAGLLGHDGLDVELDVFAGHRQYRYLSQIKPLDATHWVRAVAGDAASGPGNVLNAVLSSRMSADLPGPFHDDTDFAHPPEPWCTDWTKVGERDADTTVASAVARPGATAIVKYERGSRTQASTGVSLGGGVFTVNGERTRESSLYVDWGREHAGPGRLINREYQVNVKHGIFRARCARSYPYRGELPDIWYVTSPERLTGGVQPIASRLPLWTCRPNDRLSKRGFADEVGTDTAEAYTYTAGFELTSKWGTLTGHSLSGYDQHTGVHFRFDDKRRGYWCGDSGDPLAPHQRVQGFQR
jgi:hypothetical protein